MPHTADREPGGQKLRIEGEGNAHGVAHGCMYPYNLYRCVYENILYGGKWENGSEGESAPLEHRPYHHSALISLLCIVNCRPHTIIVICALVAVVALVYTYAMAGILYVV